MRLGRGLALEGGGSEFHPQDPHNRPGRDDTLIILAHGKQRQAASGETVSDLF